MKINSADPNKQIEKFDINVISIKDLIDLSNRALNIDELTSFSSRSSSYKEHKKAEQLLERWEKLIEIRTEKKNNLDHRLALMGLDRSQMLEKLQTQCELQPEDIPVWGTQLGKILNNTAYSPWIENLLANLENSNELLFPEFLHPFIAYYLEELTLFHPDWELLVELPALKQLAVYLLSRLSHLCGRTVAYEIKQQDKLGLLARKTPQERYQYYTKELLGNTRGLFDFLNRYPVLGRLLSIVTDQAIQNTIKWFTRLKGDRTAIATTFTEDKELGKVVSLQPGLSDPHNGGETVWFVSFACGLKLAYKPRSLAIDVAYHKLLKWFNSLSSVPSLRAASVLARQGYGWVAWIETTECKDRKEVSQYYQRQGAHLALFYFLCGNDFHEDNFLPAGAYPIPIDLETIAALALSFNSSEEIANLPIHWKQMAQSVIFTTMLPRWQSGSFDRELTVMAGIAGRDEQRNLPVPWGVWHNLGTPQLKLEYEYLSPQPASCLPKLDGCSIGMQPFLPQVLEGFTQTYQTFLTHRNFLISDDSPLRAFQDLPTRILVRNTEEYARLLSWMTAPDNLTSGKAYDVALEVICDGRIGIGGKSQFWFKLIQAEKEAIWQQDIPYFEGSISGRYVSDQKKILVNNINQWSGYELIQERIASASKEDLNWQKQLISASFEMFFTPDGIPLSEDQKPSAVKKLPPKTISTNLELDIDFKRRMSRHLLMIAETIAKLAVNHSDGISWLTLERVRQYNSLVSIVNPVPWSIVGAAGTAVFLANLAAYTGNDTQANLALETCKKAAHATGKYNNTRPLFANLHLKGLNGLAIVIFALSVCADRLQDKSCLELAADLVKELSIAEWGGVKDPEFLNGSASALLAITLLYQKTSDEEILERAVGLAKAIVSFQVENGGFKGNIATNRPLIGMAHGTAGIAYPLSVLYSITRSDFLKKAISKALAYERSHFDLIHQDWPNLQRSGSNPSFMSGWCSGAPGIGLARLGMLDRFEDPQLTAEIETACQATLRYLGTGRHHFCCGEAGRIIFLTKAAIKLNRPELYRAAMEAAEKMLDFYDQKGFWKLQMFAARSIVPGLSDGVAGVGLSLLTVLEPQATQIFGD